MEINKVILFPFLNCYSITLAQCFPLCPPLPSPPPTPNSHSPPCSPCPWVIHTCSLTSPFPFFPSLSPSLLPSVTVSLFHVSVPLVLFYLLVYFVHQIPLIGEIIWYLPFTTWLISLNIIFSSSIHAIAKGRIFSFLWPGSIPLCQQTVFKVTTCERKSYCPKSLVFHGE